MLCSKETVWCHALFDCVDRGAKSFVCHGRAHEHPRSPPSLLDLLLRSCVRLLLSAKYLTSTRYLTEGHKEARSLWPAIPQALGPYAGRPKPGDATFDLLLNKIRVCST